MINAVVDTSSVSKVVLNQYLKYAEVTVIKNTKERTFYNSFKSFIGFDEEEIIDKNNDRVLMSFEDEPPFDTKDYYEDFKFNITTGFQEKILYIDDNITNSTCFLYAPRVNEKGLKIQSFSEVTRNNQKYKNSIFTISYYNQIFYKNITETEKKEKEKTYGCNINSLLHNVLYIVRLNSTSTMPRYVVAYDETHYKKEHIIYLVRNIFLELYTEQ